MSEWIAAALLVACALGVLVMFVRVQIHLDLQGRGEPNGAWALAGGASLGPVSLAGVSARGVPPTAYLHVFKRRLLSRRITLPEKKEPDPDEVATSLAERYRRLERWFDPLALVIFLFDETRRIGVHDLEVDVGYSFENIMVTSQVMSVLYVLESILPEPFVLRQEPSWEFEDRAKLDGSAVIAFRPALLVMDLIVFFVRNVRLRRPTLDAPQAIGS